MKVTHLVAILFISACLCLFFSCQSNERERTGFNVENSDPKAINVADEVMEAMGGSKNWEDTRHISWTFFDSRRHFWDKHTGDVRIESLKDDLIILMNINSMEGKVKKDGQVLTHLDSLSKYLKMGKRYWINDSYWLVMPYKLKDPGVTLKYMGEDTVNGQKTDVLQLTFEEVGVTPENRYLVYVDQNRNLVTQWAFFRNAEQAKPDFVMPWENYQKYGNILLSDKRGEASLSNIAVYESLPKEIYDSFEPVSI